MSASSPAEKKSLNKGAYLCYFIYLIFPAITLILLITHPWIQNRQCKPEFPVIASVVAGIEIFIFILFVLCDPLTNAHGKEASEKRSMASYGRVSGAVAYFTIFITSLIFMWQSSEYCGIAIYFWTMLSFFFRGPIVGFAVGAYEEDKRSNEGPIAL